MKRDIIDIIEWFKSFFETKDEKKRNKQLLETDYGRLNGWSVFLDDVKIAELLNPKYNDMFWMYYDLISVDEKVQDKLNYDCFWLEHTKKLKFLSNSLNQYAEHAIITVPDDIQGTNKISARGLYIQ